MTDESPPRPGSTQDLSRRMDKIEQKQDDQARDLSALTVTIGRVEDNQKHADELNKLNFSIVNTAVDGARADLKAFMARIEGIVSGEVDTAQGRQGRELVEDYRTWRKGVDERLDRHDTFETQGRLLGRIGVLLVTSNIIAIIAAIAAMMKPAA